MPLDRDSLTMERLRPIITFIIIIWVIQFANFALGYRPNIWFGLEPRDFGGLVGIPLSPLLHGGFMHAAANTVPLLILGGMAAMAAPKRFIEATLIIVLVGGALVWLMARGGNRVHVGAMLYGGLVMGIFPGNPQVSWESHLFGALAGAAAAWMLRSDKGATPHVT